MHEKSCTVSNWVVAGNVGVRTKTWNTLDAHQRNLHGLAATPITGKKARPIARGAALFAALISIAAICLMGVYWMTNYESDQTQRATVAAVVPPNYLGRWVYSQPDGSIQISITSNRLKMKVTQKGIITHEEVLVLGKEYRRPDGMLDVLDDQFSGSSRVFDGTKLIAEVLDKRGSDRLAGQHYEGMLSLARALPKGPLHALRLAGLDHCTDRSLISAGDALILRIDCKYEYALLRLIKER